jgi:hypothetical protein
VFDGPELRFIFDFESGERHSRIFFEDLVFAVATSPFQLERTVRVS